MSDYDFLPPEDESVPDKLQKKWDKEEFEDEIRMIECPHCSKVIRADSFACIYCGDTVMHHSGLLGWMKYSLLKGYGQGKVLHLILGAILIVGFIAIVLTLLGF